MGWRIGGVERWRRVTPTHSPHPLIHNHSFTTSPLHSNNGYYRTNMKRWGEGREEGKGKHSIPIPPSTQSQPHPFTVIIIIIVRRWRGWVKEGKSGEVNTPHHSAHPLSHNLTPHKNHIYYCTNTKWWGGGREGKGRVERWTLQPTPPIHSHSFTPSQKWYLLLY